MRLGLVFATLMALGLVPVSRADVIPVTTTVDEFGTGAGCSLREAVKAANDDAAFGGCPAGSGVDQITVPAGTYTLAIAGTGEDADATGDLDVLQDATIVGAGASSTIVDGGGLDRVFDVASGATVSISDLTVRNGAATGDAGGGILSNGMLTLSNLIVTGNAADGGGGLALNGPANTVSHCTISGNTAATAGGGFEVQNGGSATVATSTVSGNGAPFGGGVLNLDTLVLRNTTLSGNTASSEGGGVYNNGTLELHNVTIAANSSSGNVGGLFNNNANGTTTTQNSLLGDNTSATPANADCGGTLASAGHNLVEMIGGCTITGNTTGNITGQDPALDPLGDNGGPTQTHLPQTGSPARDTGDPGVPGSGGTTCEGDDQIGTTRPVGAACDIGAVEAPPAATTTTTSTSSTTSTTVASCQVWPGYDLTGTYSDWWYLRVGDVPSLAVDLRPRQRVQNSGNLPLCKITLCLGQANGTPTGQMHLEVYSDKTSTCAPGENWCPDQKLGGDSDSYDVSQLTTTATGGDCGTSPTAGRFVTFSWPGNQPAPAGDFWIVLTSDSAPNDLQGDVEFASLGASQHPAGCGGALCSDYSVWSNDGTSMTPPANEIDRVEDMVGQVMYDPTPPTTTTSSTTSTSTTSSSTTSTSSTSSTSSSTSSTTSSTSSTTSTTLAPVCANGTTISKGAIVLGKLGAPTGNERLTFTGRLDFGPGVPASFDPATTGAQILIEDLGTGSAIGAFDLTYLTTPVPPGAPGSGCGPRDGWKHGAYRNVSDALAPPGCPPGSADGLKSVKLVDRRARGKGIGFTVSARNATIAAVSGPLRGTLVLGATSAQSLAGECGAVTFTTARCKRKGATLSCR